jgi:hypothetical protein
VKWSSNVPARLNREWQILAELSSVSSEYRRQIGQAAVLDRLDALVNGTGDKSIVLQVIQMGCRVLFILSSPLLSPPLRHSASCAI